MKRVIIPLAMAIVLQLAGVLRIEGQSTAAPVVTADIQAGIEKHIEEQVVKGGGHFQLPFQKETLQLKLVKVHTEYLANLGPRSHFACVDLVDTKGDVYDVDFFLKGDPGAMTVTETTVHKLNGIPYYLWDQANDGTWHRIEVNDGKDYHFGIRRSNDEFDFQYRATLPEITGPARMWIPLATSDEFQQVERISTQVPGKLTEVTDKEHGNRILFVELGPEDSKKTLEIRYHVRRNEKAAYGSDPKAAERHLKAERLVPIDEKFKKIAQEVVAEKKGEMVRARAIYDHVIESMKYAKAGPGWGKGDAVYACDARNGNCTDYHAYFIALARASNIPARFAIGAALPSDRNDGGCDGYHCWAEFYADGKWWPIDISEADKYSSLATYYFGHHPANRVEFSRGRDLEVDPMPASGPINFLAYPVLEIDGKLAKTKNEFLFHRKAAGR